MAKKKIKKKAAKKKAAKKKVTKKAKKTAKKYVHHVERRKLSAIARKDFTEYVRRAFSEYKVERKGHYGESAIIISKPDSARIIIKSSDGNYHGQLYVDMKVLRRDKMYVTKEHSKRQINLTKLKYIQCTDLEIFHEFLKSTKTLKKFRPDGYVDILNISTDEASEKLVKNLHKGGAWGGYKPKFIDIVGNIDEIIKKTKLKIGAGYVIRHKEVKKPSGKFIEVYARLFHPKNSTKIGKRKTYCTSKIKVALSATIKIKSEKDLNDPNNNEVFVYADLQVASPNANHSYWNSGGISSESILVDSENKKLYKDGSEVVYTNTDWVWSMINGGCDEIKKESDKSQKKTADKK